MEFKKLNLKKARVMELSDDVESLPLDKTDQVAGGATTSFGICQSEDCTTLTFTMDADCTRG